MKAIGEVEVVGGAHFVERPALLAFLDRMIAAPSIEQALRTRLLEAEPLPKPKTLRVSLPEDLRRARLLDLPVFELCKAALPDPADRTLSIQLMGEASANGLG